MSKRGAEFQGSKEGSFIGDGSASRAMDDAPRKATAAQLANRNIKSLPKGRKPGTPRASVQPPATSFGFGGAAAQQTQPTPQRSSQPQPQQGGFGFGQGGGAGSAFQFGGASQSFPAAQASTPAPQTSTASFPPFGGATSSSTTFSAPVGGFNFSAGVSNSNPFAAVSSAPVSNGTTTAAAPSSAPIFNFGPSIAQSDNSKSSWGSSLATTKPSTQAPAVQPPSAPSFSFFGQGSAPSFGQPVPQASSPKSFFNPNDDLMHTSPDVSPATRTLDQPQSPGIARTNGQASPSKVPKPPPKPAAALFTDGAQTTSPFAISQQNLAPSAVSTETIPPTTLPPPVAPQPTKQYPPGKTGMAKFQVPTIDAPESPENSAKDESPLGPNPFGMIARTPSPDRAAEEEITKYQQQTQQSLFASKPSLSAPKSTSLAPSDAQSFSTLFGSNPASTPSFGSSSSPSKHSGVYAVPEDTTTPVGSPVKGGLFEPSPTKGGRSLSASALKFASTVDNSPQKSHDATQDSTFTFRSTWRDLRRANHKATTMEKPHEAMSTVAMKKNLGVDFDRLPDWDKFVINRKQAFSRLNTFFMSHFESQRMCGDWSPVVRYYLAESQKLTAGNPKNAEELKQKIHDYAAQGNPVTSQPNIGGFPMPVFEGPRTNATAGSKRKNEMEESPNKRSKPADGGSVAYPDLSASTGSATMSKFKSIVDKPAANTPFETSPAKPLFGNSSQSMSTFAPAPLKPSTNTPQFGAGGCTNGAKSAGGFSFGSTTTPAAPNVNSMFAPKQAAAAASNATPAQTRPLFGAVDSGANSTPAKPSNPFGSIDRSKPSPPSAAPVSNMFGSSIPSSKPIGGNLFGFATPVPDSKPAAASAASAAPIFQFKPSGGQPSAPAPSTFKPSVPASTEASKTPSLFNGTGSSAAKPPAFQIPTFGAPTTGGGMSFMSEFTKKSTANEKEELEKRKLEDLDSDEDDTEWTKKQTAEQQLKKQKLANITKSSTGFSFNAGAAKPSTSESLFKLPKAGGEATQASFSSFAQASSTSSTPQASFTSSAPPKTSLFGSNLTPATAGPSILASVSFGSNKSVTSGNIFGHLSDVESGAEGDDKESEDEAEDSNQEKTSNKVGPTSSIKTAASNSSKQSDEETDSERVASKGVSPIPSGTATPTSGRSLFDRMRFSTDGKPERDAAPAANAFNPVGSTTPPSKPAGTLFGGGITQAGTSSTSLFGASTNSTGTASFGTSLFGGNKPVSPHDNTFKHDSPIKFGASTTAAPSLSFTPASPAKKDTSKSEAPKPFSSLFGSAGTSSFGAGTSSFGASSTSAFGASSTPAAAPAPGAPSLFSFNPSTASSAPSSTINFSFGAPKNGAPAPSSLFPSAPGATAIPSTFNSAAPSRATTPGLTGDEASANESANEGAGEEFSKQSQSDLAALTEQELADEDVLFEVKTKAMMHSRDAGSDPSKSWVSKGVGPLRILRNKSTGLTRILMRIPSGKIVINSRLLADVEPKNPQSKVVQTVLVDGGKPTTWVLRFGDVDSPGRFVEVYKQNRPDKA